MIINLKLNLPAGWAGNQNSGSGTCPERSRMGFTIIELLVAIAIIAILATLVMVNYIGAQKKSRDSKRKADLESLQQAVYMYKDAHDALPGSTGNVKNLTELINYIDALPSDPKKSSEFPDYYYYNGGTTFSFFSDLENTDDHDAINYGKGCTIKISVDKSSVYRYRVPKIPSPGITPPCL